MSIFLTTKALHKKLLAMPGVLPTAFENAENFKPTANQPYQTVHTVQLSPENPTFGDNFYRERGFMRVRLMYPQNTGVGAVYQYAEQLRSWFKRGTSMREGSIDVTIRTTPSISTGNLTDDRYVVNVDIEYYVNVC